MMQQQNNFFFKFDQIYMKEPESTEKSNLRFFQLLFLELFLWRHHPNFQWIFHDYLKNKNQRIFFIVFSTLRIFHESGIKTEVGGLLVVSWGRARFNEKSFEVLFLVRHRSTLGIGIRHHHHQTQRADLVHRSNESSRRVE